MRSLFLEMQVVAKHRRSIAEIRELRAKREMERANAEHLRLEGEVDASNKRARSSQIYPASVTTPAQRSGYRQRLSAFSTHITRKRDDAQLEKVKANEDFLFAREQLRIRTIKADLAEESVAAWRHETRRMADNRTDEILADLGTAIQKVRDHR